MRARAPRGDKRTDGKRISNLHDGRPLVAPTTVKEISRYKSKHSATLKPVGALIERPLGRKATQKAFSHGEGGPRAVDEEKAGVRYGYLGF